MKRRRPTLLFSAVLAAAAAWSCRKTEVPAKAPSVRLYLMSTLAGAMEPCGCRKDMLGGIDHAAALLAAERESAPHRLLLAAGPLFFQDPTLGTERREQDLWKAEAIALSLADLGLAAWAPGENDFAAGPEALAGLTSQSKAQRLAANFTPLAAEAPGGLPAGTALFDVGPYKVGVAGIGAGPTTAREAAPALERAARALEAAGAQIRVALLAAPRGEGLRLAEKVTGFDVVALGKPSEAGEANDGSFPPALVGETLVIQAPNHLQALSYVDLFITGDDFTFEDGTGIAAKERIESVKRRMKELEVRMSRANGTAQAGELKTLLERARAELATLEQGLTAPKRQGSTFRYHETPIREGLGSDPDVARRMGEYYRKVNEHNRVAFADRKPKPVAEGEARYVGAAMCTNCHGAATRFWKKTPHATAYESLARDHKEFNLDCVGCHVTGYERPGGSTVTHVEFLKDVQCESCHGPASRHVEGGGDTRYITLTPPESQCRSCHHPPHVADDWDFRASWSKIIGEGHGAHPVGEPGKPAR